MIEMWCHRKKITSETRLHGDSAPLTGFSSKQTTLDAPFSVSVSPPPLHRQAQIEKQFHYNELIHFHSLLWLVRHTITSGESYLQDREIDCCCSSALHFPVQMSQS